MQKIWWFLGLALFLFSCKSSRVVSDVQTAQLSNDAGQAVDSSIIDFVNPYAEELNNTMGKVLVYSDVALTKSLPESPLTNCVTDIFLDNARAIAETLTEKPQADMAYINYYSLRAELPKGAVTYGNVFETFPFENEIVYLKVKGDKLQAFAEITAQRGGDCIAGMQLVVAKNGSPKSIRVQGELLDGNKGYWVVTSDYIANGGDNMTMFANPIKRVDSGVKVRDSYIRYFKQMQSESKKLSGRKDGRIVYEQ